MKSRTSGPRPVVALVAGAPIALVFALAALLAPAPALAVACASIANSAWNVQTTWGAAGVGCVGAPGGIPGAADDVTINNTHNVSLIANRTVLSLTINAGGTVTTGNFGVTIAAGAGVLVVNGNVAGNGNAASRVIKLSTGNLSGGGTFTNLQDVTITGDTTIAAGSNLTLTGAECRIALSANTDVINNGTLTFNTPASCGTASTLTLTATSTWTNNGTVSAQTVTGASGAVWTNAADSVLNVRAAFLTTAGTVLNASANNNTVNYSGTVAQTVKVPSANDYYHLTFSGTGNRDPVTASTYNVLGDFTVGAGTTWRGAQPANDPAVNITGKLINNGTFTTGNDAYTLGGDFTNNGTFTHTAAGTFTLNGTAAQAIGGTTAATFVALTITNTSAAVTANTNFNVNTGTLNMNGANTLLAPAAAVVVGGSGTLTGTGTVQVTLNGADAFLTQYTITNKTLTNLTVEYIGTAAQTVSTVTYGGLKVNNASGVSLAAGTTVNGTLTLESGDVTTGAFSLVTAASCAAPSVVRTSGHVIGNLQKAIPAGASSCTFEVGSAAGYIPIGTTFVAGTTAGNMTASATGLEHTSIGSSGINSAASVNRYWTLANGGVGLPGAGFTAVFNFITPGDYDGGADPAKFTVQRFSAGWFDTTVNATCTPIPGSYLCNQVDNLAAFGDFAIGEANYTGGNAGWFNVFETSTGAGATLGNIYTKIAGTAFTLDVVAVNARRNGVKPGYSTNPITVDLLNASDNSGALTAETDCRASWTLVQSLSLSPAWASSRATITIPAQASALKEGRVRVTQGTLVGCSTDNFTIRPTLFTVSSTNAANTGTSGTPAIKTGVNFNLTAASVAGYNGTPSVDNTAGMVIGTPTAGTIGGTFSAASIITGTASGSAFTYSEVGNFGLAANAVYDSSFTVDASPGDCNVGFSNTLDGAGRYGCSIGSTAVPQTTGSSGFGRFIPDHFSLTAVGTMTQGCVAGGFSYMEQNMSFSGVKIEARNSADVKTANYAGAYAKLDPTSFSAFNFGARDSGGAGTNLTSRISGVLNGTNSWLAGELTLAVDSLTIARAASPDGAYDATKIGIAPADPDDPSVVLNAFDFDVDGVGGNDHARIGAADTKWRFGRLRMLNASGSEKLDLPIPLQAQYWTGSVFATNAADDCTSLTAGNLAFSDRTGGITLGNMNAANISLGGAFAAGVGSLKLIKPTTPVPTIPGSATLTVDLAAELKTYLQGNWGVPTYTANPRARVGFGIYGAQPRQFIFFRENY